eukprot:scaffold125357_cov69-Phaeocystis_antarctica.AAC.1
MVRRRRRRRRMVRRSTMHVPCIDHACGPDELDDGAEATAGREALGRRQVVARLAPRTAACAAAVGGRLAGRHGAA